MTRYVVVFGGKSRMTANPIVGLGVRLLHWPD
jgi:hypothetical protein